MNLLNSLIARLGDSITASSGSEFRWCCPFCHEKRKLPDTKYHLYINTDKQLFHCHRCGIGGGVGYLLKRLGIRVEHNAAQWGELVRSLSYISGKDYDEKYDHTEPIEYPCDVVVPEKGMDAYAYLTGPKTSKFKKTGLNCRGLTRATIEAYGLVVGTGIWRSRIFIPTFWNGELTFWVARDFSGWAEDGTKYLNPEGRSRRYHIGNLDKVIDNYNYVVITEGPFSGIAAGPWAVWTYGKHITGEQIHQLVSPRFVCYYVALDGDALAQSISTCRRLQAFGCNVRLVSIPYGDDPDSVANFMKLFSQAEPFTFKSEVAARLEKM